MFFLKRRHFVKAGAGLIASQILPSPPAHADVIRGVQRTTTLAPSSAAVNVQDVLALENAVICLYRNVPRGAWGISGTTPSGTALWNYALPKGMYLGLGTMNNGQSVLVHALHYFVSNKEDAIANCILRLDPALGETSVVGTADATGSGARLHYAGDGRLLRYVAGQIEIWSVNDGVAMERRADFQGVLSSGPHVDLIAPNMIALTPRDASGFVTLDLSSGGVYRCQIDSPDIAHAKSLADSLYRKGMDPNTVKLTIISATGSDPAGNVNCLLSARDAGAARLVFIDRNGVASPLGSFQFGKLVITSTPLKLIKYGAEIGVACAAGTVVWYAV